MKICNSSELISQELNALRSQGKTVGFVPTMGALHRGHTSLTRRSAEGNDVTVASIFVNPLQFNNKADFENYPSTLEKDVPALEESGCTFLFHPDYKEVYPTEDHRDFDLGDLASVMEGKFRPGHFQGVANVVYRFFDIVRPDKAYFGLKDYQQYLVIKRIVAPFFPGLEIIGVETVRDEKGLAMSSRNLRLTPAQYESAVKVPGLMKKIRGQWGKMGPEQISEEFNEKVASIPELRPEYLEIAHAGTLQPATGSDDPADLRIFAAFYAGDIRLIDNMALSQ